MSKVTKATKAKATKKVQLAVPQNAFLYEHLRGTGNTLTASEALAQYGIKNLSARMSEFRGAGLVVNLIDGAYSVSSRDINGSRARVEV